MLRPFKEKGYFKTLEEFVDALDFMHKKGLLNCKNNQVEKYYSVNTIL